VGGNVEASKQKSNLLSSRGEYWWEAMWRLRRRRLTCYSVKGRWVRGDVEASQEKSNLLSSGWEGGWEPMWRLRRRRVPCYLVEGKIGGRLCGGFEAEE
jgi:hypothetical protein